MSDTEAICLSKTTVLNSAYLYLQTGSRKNKPRSISVYDLAVDVRFDYEQIILLSCIYISINLFNKASSLNKNMQIYIDFKFGLDMSKTRSQGCL